MTPSSFAHFAEKDLARLDTTTSDMVQRRNCWLYSCLAARSSCLLEPTQRLSNVA